MNLRTTRAALFRSPTDVIIAERSMPGPSDREIVVEIDACSICGTDLTAFFEGRKEYEGFGHEIAGRVAAVGALVEGPAVGAPIVLESSSCCGQCSACRNMRQDLCENVVSFWPQGFFGFAERMLSPAISAVPYEGLSPAVACLSEPLGVALDMHRLAEINPGSIVLVSGLGPIGLMAIRLAKLSGARKIYAVSYSRLTARNEMALRFGADEVIFEDKTPIVDYSFKESPDRFFVTTPPGVLPSMFHVAARGAILTYIGIKYGEAGFVRFDANDFHFKKLQLRASHASPAMMTPMALRLLQAGSVDGEALITHRFGLDEMAEAVRVASFEKAQCIKVVMVR